MSYQNKKYRSSAPKKSKRAWWVAGIIVIVVAVIGFGCYWKFIRKTPPAARPVSADANTKGEPASATPPTPNSATASQSSGSASSSPAQPGSSNSAGKQDQGTPNTTNVTLQVPEGNFVSNHQASAGTSEQSTCTTTPGASCVITFTKGSVTKSLSAQVTDRGGTTYWNNWTPQSIGLNAGNWTIEAVATLGGQTKTAADALQLQVSS